MSDFDDDILLDGDDDEEEGGGRKKQDQRPWWVWAIFIGVAFIAVVLISLISAVIVSNSMHSEELALQKKAEEKDIKLVPIMLDEKETNPQKAKLKTGISIYLDNGCYVARFRNLALAVAEADKGAFEEFLSGRKPAVIQKVSRVLARHSREDFTNADFLDSDIRTELMSELQSALPDDMPKIRDIYNLVPRIERGKCSKIEDHEAFQHFLDHDPA